MADMANNEGIGPWGAAGIGLGCAVVGGFFGLGVGARVMVGLFEKSGYDLVDPTTNQAIDWQTGARTPYAPTSALPAGTPATASGPVNGVAPASGLYPNRPLNAPVSAVRAKWCETAFRLLSMVPNQWNYLTSADKTTYINRLINIPWTLPNRAGNPSGAEMGYAMNDYAAGRPVRASYV